MLRIFQPSWIDTDHFSCSMRVVKIRFSLCLYWNLEDGEGHCVSLNAIHQTFQSAVTTPVAFLKRFNKTCSKFLPPKTHKRKEKKAHNFTYKGCFGYRRCFNSIIQDDCLEFNHVELLQW